MFGFISTIFNKKGQKAQTQSPQKKVIVVDPALKNEALVQAQALTDDESIISFLKQCRFADARFIAVQKITSLESLEKVKEITQKTDRRVMKWAQAQIERLNQKMHLLQKIESFLRRGADLVADVGLTPNKVADLDREWNAFLENKKEDISQDAKAHYQQIRLLINERLDKQLIIQQEMKSALAQLKTLDLQQDVLPAERTKQLSVFKNQLNHWVNSLEKQSIPKSLLSDFEITLSRLVAQNDNYQKEFDAIAAREAWLTEKEQAKDGVSADELKRQWQTLPIVNNKSAFEPLNARYKALIASTSEQQEHEIESGVDLISRFYVHLEALRVAIEKGSLHEALDHDLVLGQLNLNAIGVMSEQIDEYNQLHAECRRLTGWEKWNGEINREKLIREAQDLANQKLSIQEMARAVVDLRNRWKALNSKVNMANREQWQAFDQACNKAYEPVLAFAKSQEKEKESNILKAEQILKDVATFVENFTQTFQAHSPKAEWKPLVDFYRKTLKSWRTFGIVGSKEKKRLDQELAKTIGPLKQVLLEKTKIEIAKRRELIASVAQIDATRRDSGDALKAVQQEWQKLAKAFPLDNKEDKKLWTAFREACEAIHGKRMEKNKELDVVRYNNLKAKSQCCEVLEKLAQGDDIAAIASALQQEKQTFNAIGVVPKKEEASIEKRFNQACEACQKKVLVSQREELKQALQPLSQKLSLCVELEQAVYQALSSNNDDNMDDQSFETRWKELPALPQTLEKLLHHRFNNGLKAFANHNSAYAKRMDNAQEKLRDSLLMYEVLFATATPAHLEQERAAKQVEVLQNRMAGSETPDADTVAKTLLESACLMTKEDQDRICRILFKVNEPAQ